MQTRDSRNVCWITNFTVRSIGCSEPSGRNLVCRRWRNWTHDGPQECLSRIRAVHEVNGQLLLPMNQNLWVEGTSVSSMGNGWMVLCTEYYIFLNYALTYLLLGKRLIKVLLQSITKTSVKWPFMKGKRDLHPTGSRIGKGLYKLNIHIPRNYSFSESGPSNWLSV